MDAATVFFAAATCFLGLVAVAAVVLMLIDEDEKMTTFPAKDDLVALSENYTATRWDGKRRTFPAGFQFTVKDVDTETDLVVVYGDDGTGARWPIPLAELESVRKKR